MPRRDASADGKICQGALGLVCCITVLLCCFVNLLCGGIGFETTGGFITQLGTWENVRHQCKKGRVQPSMLFFESGLDPWASEHPVFCLEDTSCHVSHAPRNSIIASKCINYCTSYPSLLRLSVQAYTGDACGLLAHTQIVVIGNQPRCEFCFCACAWCKIHSQGL